MMATVTELLSYVPALDRIDLLAEPTAAALKSWLGAVPAADIWVAQIDPEVADTAACCARYGLAMEDSANCVVIAGRRGEVTRLVACIVLATTRADVNGVVRKRLDVRKASFASMDSATSQSGMEYGGITPFGLPDDWSIFVDARVVQCERAVFGSGIRGSKLFAPGRALLDLPNVDVVEGLAFQ